MKQKFIEWFTNNNNGCSPEMAGDGSFEREKTQHMFVAYQAGMAEGEAKCAALAAENAWLKESRQRLAEFIHEELDADYPLNMDIETQETDTFLAEVRAQGVDMFSEKFGGGTLLSNMVKETAKDFAAQLRKGVQS
ncbi:hypothetical protein [Enterobacter ludwigii]|uniref:hypothetical protein n=1 Tax=Enterobacter ludwigii TaxID=299767 RepID=UPI001C8C2E1A|nr:hypothetical protein [Enterobacter ludwigii]MBX8877383.1 hypothetical protein [Enterobacter ludwigii]WNI43789.1 hypothetical protein RIK66_15565 [Enterobacter ludwigii]WNI55509.1 hypothetical protein RIL74_06975 [Enterobacter ludwigii]WNI80584.1 hypothetical protein RIK68_19725 [Enterobacter ludwigii]HDR2560609.1 hypothetical protein [Enterobacter ludwigii]